MIRRFCYGTVFETDAVLNKPAAEDAALPFFTVDPEERSFTCPMDRDAVVYGLGENVRGINKRGWIYESRCSDEPHHHEDKKSLYAAHNFILYDGADRRFGLFIDYPGILTFDVGFTDLSVLKITAADWNLDAYLIEGTDDLDIVRQFRRLIGRSYIPPVWAFGVGQSRWGYMNEADVRQVVRRYRELGLPLDMVYLAACVCATLYLSQRLIHERITFMETSFTATDRADHDALTGIYNRRGGEHLISNYVANGVTGAFMLVDIDNFKHINDDYGHAAGDETLKAIAVALQKNFRETDVVMRMGGDEFIVYAVGMADIHFVTERLERTKASLHMIHPDMSDEGEYVTASIGCVINLGSYPDYDSLSAAADKLLYLVKEEGKDNYKVSSIEYKG